MAIVLAVIASVMCAVTMLTPQRLAAVARGAAAQYLDADVRIGSVDWTLNPNTGHFTLVIDSVTVISDPMKRLPGQMRRDMPAWADTLLTLRRFEGGVSVLGLMRGRIDLYDVAFDNPCINLYQINDSVSNYLIYRFDQNDTVPMGPLPQITLNSFRITNPGPLRFRNHATGEHFELQLNSLAIRGSNQPRYDLDMGGSMAAPSLALYNLDKVDFGVHGNMAWNPAKPTELDLRNFTLRANFISARTNAIVDFGRDIMVRKYSLSLDRTPVASIVEMLPDSLRTEYALNRSQFETDCDISFNLQSTAPFNLAVDSVPHADLTVNLWPGSLRVGKAKFDRVEGTVRAQLHGNDINTATFQADNVRLKGPATTLSLNASASEVMADPLLEGCLKADSELGRLPGIVYRMARGYMSGRVTADVDFALRPSMMQRNRFHHIKLKGDVSGRNVYYLSDDTANMAMIYRARLHFGTTRSDSTLRTRLEVDSARILHTKYSMNIAGLRLGAGVANRASSADTTAVLPMGADLRLDKFYMTVLSDSMAMDIRGAKGRITVQQFNNLKKLPIVGFNLDVHRISSGSPEMRFLMLDSHIDTKAVKRDRRRSAMSPAVKRAADSIRAVAPHLSMDSVYARAIRDVRKKHRGYPRVHPEILDSNEIIDWGTSHTLRTLLTDWTINGSMTARRAGLFTPYFPVRNRVRNFNMTFNNDSILLGDVSYKAGHSDFLVSGLISNIRRGFTSRGYRIPLKLEFVVLSDSIDINQLADGTFRGSAYATAHTPVKPTALTLNKFEADEARSDEALERELGRMVQNAPDSMAPLLVPKNIEADIRMLASNVLYSDMAFNDFSGQMLVSQGALNLHDLNAQSAMGSVNMSALYSSESLDDIKFGFGMKVDRFNIKRFIKLVPAVDSIMPLLHDLRGIIDADIAATCNIDSAMNLVLPSLQAAVRISGDSLAIANPKAYENLAKWLMFKNRRTTVIDSMNVEMTVKDNVMHMYPFIFNLDRYRIGVQGYNDLSMNFRYHLAVLKSPLPFKFGVNLSGNPDNIKVRLGKARFSEHQAMVGTAIVDTARISLLGQIEHVFRRGVANSRFAHLDIASKPLAADINLDADTLTHADSLALIREGLIPAPQTPKTKKESFMERARHLFSRGSDDSKSDNTPAPAQRTDNKAIRRKQ